MEDVAGGGDRGATPGHNCEEQHRAGRAGRHSEFCSHGNRHANPEAGFQELPVTGMYQSFVTGPGGPRAHHTSRLHCQAWLAPASRLPPRAHFPSSTSRPSRCSEMWVTLMM